MEHPAREPAAPPPSILFLDKVLAGPGRRPPRGVELFNLNLIGDLARRGHRVTAPVHPDWQPPIRRAAGDAPVNLVGPDADEGENPPRGWMIRAASRQRADLLLLANVANRLIPCLIWLRLRRAARHCVLIAHREPSRRSLRAQKAWPSTVVAVNRTIAGHYRRAGFDRVSVYYGVTEADRFFPAPERPEGETVNFCVAGDLDNPWKGSDTAVAAFGQLDPAVRQRCRLHLASFSRPPEFGDPRIVGYRWMPASAMPDFFRRMDVMIVPSRDRGVMMETFSQVMVQGMLSGLPVIAGRLPVLEEKLDRGGGVVFDDVPGLAAAMARLAGDPGLRRELGRAGRETARARYVWDTGLFAEKFLRQY